MRRSLLAFSLLYTRRWMLTEPAWEPYSCVQIKPPCVHLSSSDVRQITGKKGHDPDPCDLGSDFSSLCLGFLICKRDKVELHGGSIAFNE